MCSQQDDESNELPPFHKSRNALLQSGVSCGWRRGGICRKHTSQIKRYYFFETEGVVIYGIEVSLLLRQISPKCCVSLGPDWRNLINLLVLVCRHKPWHDAQRQRWIFTTLPNIDHWIQNADGKEISCTNEKDHTAYVASIRYPIFGLVTFHQCKSISWWARHWWTVTEQDYNQAKKY